MGFQTTCEGTLLGPATVSHLLPSLQVSQFSHSSTSQPGRANLPGSLSPGGLLSCVLARSPVLALQAAPSPPPQQPLP